MTSRYENHRLITSNFQIFSEDFEYARNENDFIDIETQNVHIKIENEIKEIQVTKGKSILEAGLEASINLQYSCQTGNCSVCRGKLLSGEVIQLLPKHHDLSINEFQLCCTYPKSSNVVFEI